MASRQPRYRLDDQGNVLRIVVPAPRHWFKLTFMLVWFAGWTVCSFPAIADFSRDPTLYPLVRLIIWSIGELLALYTLGWMLAGREIIEISDCSLIMRHQVFGLGPSREFLADRLTHLRVLPTMNLRSLGPYGIGPLFGSYYSWFGLGRLGFEYDRKLYAFGSRLGEYEGRMILQEIRRRFPCYGKDKPRRIYRKSGRSSGSHPDKLLNAGQASSG